FAEILTSSTLSINGKSTFKEEFVTCGGIALNEVNMRNMESRLHPNLYFGGEMLNIDAVTGGFNFQAAWTTGWLAARSIAGNQTS
ncbi:MAG TPA: NAD(P)/FAD-dependent oxidoreductase, partial [Chitinophagales bacterium]|nr:NAD(P)/FAD-dependent oxidoreductase [Chitinophagales bacterium]